ncbi:MAG: hypothetical protein FWF12_07100 [Betaproteobacteria bacterium]|nr:hypothetical protein [Betaproteobacteria bacterium]
MSPDIEHNHSFQGVDISLPSMILLCPVSFAWGYRPARIEAIAPTARIIGASKGVFVRKKRLGLMASASSRSNGSGLLPEFCQLAGCSKSLKHWRNLWAPRKTSGLAKRAKIFPMKSKGNFSDSMKQGSFSRCPYVYKAKNGRKLPCKAAFRTDFGLSCGLWRLKK